MRISDILKLPGEQVSPIPSSLLRTVADHHYVSEDTIEGVTYKRVVHHNSNTNGKYGREIGVLYVEGKEVALCLCRGKWGDTWEVIILDQEAYLSLYVRLIRASSRFEAQAPDHDVWNRLYLDDVVLLLNAGLVDSRPTPTRAENLAHLHYLIHLAGMREGVEGVGVVAVVEARDDAGGAIAHPEDLVRRVVSSLTNVRVEPYETEHLGRCVRLTLVEGPDNGLPAMR